MNVDIDYLIETTEKLLKRLEGCGEMELGIILLCALELFKKEKNATHKMSDEMTTENKLLRTLVEGLLEAATIECSSCNYDCGPNRENCIIKQAQNYINGVK